MILLLFLSQSPSTPRPPVSSSKTSPLTIGFRSSYSFSSDRLQTPLTKGSPPLSVTFQYSILLGPDNLSTLFRSVGLLRSVFPHSMSFSGSLTTSDTQYVWKDSVAMENETYTLIGDVGNSSTDRRPRDFLLRR